MWAGRILGFVRELGSLEGCTCRFVAGFMSLQYNSCSMSKHSRKGSHRASSKSGLRAAIEYASNTSSLRLRRA